MKSAPLLLLALAAAPGCATRHFDAAVAERPIGTMVPAHDWAVEVEIDNSRVAGSSSGGSFLFWSTGDSRYSPATVGGSTFLDQAPPLDAKRLDELKAAAVYDAVTKAQCEVLAYPVFWWEESGLPFIFSKYTVHVRGNPGWVRAFRELERDHVPGTNYLPDAEWSPGMVYLPQPVSEGPEGGTPTPPTPPQEGTRSSRARVFFEADVDSQEGWTGGEPSGTSWGNRTAPPARPQ